MNCFGRRPPKRVPTPPAGMTTASFGASSFSVMGLPALTEEHVQRIADGGHAADVERYLRRLDRVALRHDSPTEPESGRLAQTQLEPRDRTDLAREPDFSDDQHIRRHDTIHVARRRGYDDAEIGAGLGDAAAAGDVDVDVLAPERHARALLEHRQEQADAVVVR